MNYCDSDMSNSTNMVVFFDGKDSDLYLSLWTMSHTINMYFYDGNVSLIDGASVTIVLCLHVLMCTSHIY